MKKFSIRDLLFVTALVAMGFGWWLRERDHVAKFKQLQTDTNNASAGEPAPKRLVKPLRAKGGL